MILAVLALPLAAPGSGKYQVQLADGSLVKVLAVSDYPSQHAWTPAGNPTKPMALDEGYPLPGPKGAKSNVGLYNMPKGDLAFFLSLELKAAPFEPKKKHMQWQPGVELTKPLPVDTPPSANGGFFSIHTNSDKFGPKRWVVVHTQSAPKSATMDLTVYVADSRWRTVRQAKYRHGRVISGSDFGADVVDISSLLKRGVGPSINSPAFPLLVPLSFDRLDQRIVAYDRNGDQIFNGASWFGVYLNRPKAFRGRAGRLTAQWFISKPNEVATVKLQIRPWKKVSFHDIHTAPNG